MLIIDILSVFPFDAVTSAEGIVFLSMCPPLLDTIPLAVCCSLP
jgi:hypothetical protein